jgi:hypothetical protein
MRWEDSFQSWAKAPGQTEQTKCDNAVTAIRKAIDASTALAKRSIRVFAQGSYCNRTNVRQDSDVDVCVLCSDTFFYDLPAGKTNSDFNIISPPPYGYAQFKNEVGAALKTYFGSEHVLRGNKAFDIHENTYRIAADAVPCFRYRFYPNAGGLMEGVSFLTDAGNVVQNWPEQNYDNGVAKNTSSGQRFKDVVRILKRLRYKMHDEKVIAAAPIPSFLIESLVWNVPDEKLQRPTYSATIRSTLAHLFNNTMKFEDCKEWLEVNGCKYLFWVGQAWTWQQSHAFISAAWDYIGFE